ncbi:hypothetical protein C0J50_20658, partial [Silurus asotus]
SNLSFKNHINQVTKNSFFHRRNISKLRNMLSISDAEKLVHAFMTSRLDYCNSLLGGGPASLINKLQLVQNAAVRVPRIAKSTKGGRTFSHLAPKLWNSLPDGVRGSDTLSQFKCRLKTYVFNYCNSLLGGCPASLINNLQFVQNAAVRVPRRAKSTKGGRTFSHLAPKLWNSLPDGVRGSDTLSQFKCRLKTYVFS